MSGKTALREVVFEKLCSGLTTSHRFDAPPAALRVSWITWDSGFRHSDLQVGDLIIAINGQPIVPPAELPELQRALREWPGGLNESQTYVNQGLKDGGMLTLTVQRRCYPGEGWATLDITGHVRLERAYHAENGRRGLGPTGPDGLVNDGFDSPWSSWYEKRVFEWSKVLDGGWYTLNTRTALKSHLAEKPRVDFLSQTYPGPFADAVQADWQSVYASLEGTRYAIQLDDLAFRELEETRAKQVAVLAVEAWQQFLDRHKNELLDDNVQIDPIRGDNRQSIGKLVVLAQIPPTDWVVSLDRNFLSASRHGTRLFVAADSQAMRRVFFALQRYKRYVSPRIRDQFAIIGRLLPEPRMVVVQGRGSAGFEIEPLAVLADKAMFVDLNITQDDHCPFAGEETVHSSDVELPPADASPRQVLETLIAALKAGQQPIWNQLFADWRFISDEQRPLYYPFYPYPPGSRDEDWIRSRRLMLDTIADIRVVWIDKVHVLQSEQAYQGAPRIEQVRAELEHIGEFDGNYHAFHSSAVHRRWILQRRDNGAWRIASQQGI